MTIDFNTIKVHDLVYLDENGESGWYIVTDVRVGHHIEVRVLGEFYPLIFLDKDDLGTIHKVIRAAAVPGAIEALERLAGGELIVEGKERDAPESLQKTLGVSAQRVKDICIVGPDNSALFAVIAVRMARDALRAVRGEESA